MSLFDGFPDIFTDPDVGFGEPVIYTPAATGIATTINAIWTERPIVDGYLPGADGIQIMLDVRAEDVPAPTEDDTAHRVKTGVTFKVVTPIAPDGQGMIAVTLAKQEE